MKRWMIMAAMGLAAAAGIALPGTARASSTAWYQVYQSGFPGGFSSVAALSTSNIWAVGSAGPAFHPFIRHFNGSTWQAITIPNSSGSSSSWVAASAANNVWVGGLKNSPVATSVIYRWNGTQWGKVPVPAETDLFSVAVLAPNNVWAAGTSGLPYSVFHWNGTKWQGYPPDTLSFFPQGLSASAPNNVWLAGYSFSGSRHVLTAYHWDGSAWHKVSMPHPVISAGGTITVVSPSNVWMGWSDPAASHALHWDGHQWHTLTIPSYASSFDIVPDGTGGYWFGPQAILTGSKWASPQFTGFADTFGFMDRIPGTTSFLIPASVEVSSGAVKPTIFRFDL